MRRARESSAKGHGNPPVFVEVVDPIADHPALGPLRDRRMKRVARKARKKTAVKVEVKVDGETDAE